MLTAMATGAEPRPAALPLPGGQEGATVRLEPLLCGTWRWPPAALLREEGRFAWRKALGLGVPRSEFVVVPVQAFLLRHPGAGHLLVDTGFHPSVAVDPKANLGRPLTTISLRDIEMEPEQAVPAQLRARNVDPASIGTVVMTHLHADHASAISEFPQATFVLSSAEWTAATSQGQSHGYRRRQFDHAFDYRTLDFDGPDADSFSAFGRAFDLFGDGSVRLVFTPGHTHGHLSVLLRLRERDLLACGDAIYTMRALRDSHPPARMEDEHRWRRSLRELQLYVREHPDAVVVPGHDLAAFEALEQVYE